MSKANASTADFDFEKDEVEDEAISVTERSKSKGVVRCLLDNWFMLSTIIGVIIGFGAGFGIQQVGLDQTGKTWLGEFPVLSLPPPPPPPFQFLSFFDQSKIIFFWCISDMPGTIYIRLLKLTILPMISANIINGMS